MAGAPRTPGYNGPIQGTPIVVSGANKNLPLASGTMFVAADAGVVAIDPTNGKILWKYVGPPPKPSAPGSAPATQLIFGNTTKGFTYCNGAITTGQQDGSITAINAKTGAPLWTNEVSAVAEFAGHTGQTSPIDRLRSRRRPDQDGPRLRRPEREQFAASRAHGRDRPQDRQARLALVHHARPDPASVHPHLGQPGRGGAGRRRNVERDARSTWGSAQIYSATGNAYAQLGRQPGKDLWTASVFSLDLDTGALKWYWQETHHDLWDMDHGNPVTIMNVTIKGKSYPAFVGCDKHAYCEALDRRNGSPLPGFPMKEIPTLDPSGKGLAVNNQFPSQPWFGCTALMGMNGVAAAQAASVHFGATMPKGTACGLSYLFDHDYNDADGK